MPPAQGSLFGFAADLCLEGSNCIFDGRCDRVAELEAYAVTRGARVAPHFGPTVARISEAKKTVHCEGWPFRVFLCFVISAVCPLLYCILCPGRIRRLGGTRLAGRPRGSVPHDGSPSAQQCFVAVPDICVLCKRNYAPAVYVSLCMELADFRTDFGSVPDHSAKRHISVLEAAV